MFNYKRVSAILGAIALFCILQAFNLIQPVVNFVNNLNPFQP